MTAVGERQKVKTDVGARHVVPDAHFRFPLFILFVAFLLIASITLTWGAVLFGDMLPSSGTVTFERLINGSLDLYLLDIDRATLYNLTHSPLDDGAGAWSPDHRRLAFVSTRDDEPHLYLMTLGETDSTRLLTYGRIAPGGKPAWSPDGRYIAYELEYRGGSDLYLIEVDAPIVTNVNPRPLTDAFTDSRYPVWSPDGSQIAFVSWGDGNAEIYSVRIETMEVTNLTQHRDWDFSPAWSPDGSQIAFYSDRPSMLRELYLMDAGGGEARQLSADASPENSLFASPPVWSPNGREIAYLVTVDTSTELLIINVETGERRRLSQNFTPETRIVWLADGSGLVFMSDRGGYWDIYQMDENGDHTRQLATFAADRGTLALWDR